jgi:hypothetical protein
MSMNEIIRTCSMHARDLKSLQNFILKTARENKTFKHRLSLSLLLVLNSVRGRMD